MSNKAKRLVATIIATALLFSLFTVTAIASPITVNKSTTVSVPSADVNSISIYNNGVKVDGFTNTSIETGSNGRTTYSYQINLAPDNTQNNIVFTFNTSSGSNTTGINLNTGDSRNFSWGGNDYYVSAVTEEPYQAYEHGYCYIGAPDEDVTLEYKNSVGDVHYYEAQVGAGFPKSISLRIIPEGTGFGSVNSYTYNVTGGEGTLSNYCGTYYLASFPTNNSSIEFTVTKGSHVSNYVITAKAPTQPTGTGLAAYLPSYGQFANEGVNAGGWGDAYTSGTAGLKALVNQSTIPTTGLSLGSFGGYAVFEFADGITNNPNHPYGVDFIIYGNAFNTNAEPGCVQVSDDGQHWYDLAGSKHYSSDTIWNYAVKHTNPNKNDDNATTAPQAGTVFPAPHTYLTGTGNTYTGTNVITYNQWHAHSWYPLYANYFAVRSGSTSLANETLCSDFMQYTPKNGSTASSLELTGTRINFTSTNSSDYTFGYFDVHPNGSNVGVASNPYAANGSSAGGDGFDLAWAVNSDGTPLNLKDAAGNDRKFYYVRVYTGVDTMNPSAIFGEVSSEICGINTNVGSTTETIARPTSVKFSKQGVTQKVTIQSGQIPANGSTISKLSNIRNIAGTSGEVNIEVNAQTGANVYINDVKLIESGTTSGLYTGTISTSNNTLLRLIVQNGTASPFIFVIN